MWFADWRKIKIISFKKAYRKFTIPIFISHISNLFLIKYARKVTISILITHISNLKSIFGSLPSQYSYLTSQIYFGKFTISILISHISNLFWEIYYLNTHISHLKSIKQERRCLKRHLLLFYSFLELNYNFMSNIKLQVDVLCFSAC